MRLVREIGTGGYAYGQIHQYRREAKVSGDAIKHIANCCATGDDGGTGGQNASADVARKDQRHCRS